jgi:hypothetical protein
VERPIGRMEDVPGIEERPWDTTKPLDWTFENTYAPTRAMHQSLVKLRTNAAAPPPVSQQLISTSSRSVGLALAGAFLQLRANQIAIDDVRLSDSDFPEIP